MILEQLLPLLGSFRKQVVLVTGASSGIGKEVVLSFARQGAKLALAARRRELLGEVAQAVRDTGSEVLVVPTDVTAPRAARAAVAKVYRKWGRLDILVNNAGIMIPSPVEALQPKDLEAMLRVNVFGALSMMQAVLPLMRRQERGSIVNVASLAGRRGVSPLGGYCATKFALVGLTEALRTELDPAQIHLGLVMPGVVDTPMARSIDQDETWPAMLNMPPEWVAAAVLLAVRFRLREISVPPGAATMEVLAALTPGISDTLIRWGTAASRLLARRTSAKPARRDTKTR